MTYSDYGTIQDITRVENRILTKYPFTNSNLLQMRFTQTGIGINMRHRHLYLSVTAVIAYIFNIVTLIYLVCHARCGFLSSHLDSVKPV